MFASREDYAIKRANLIYANGFIHSFNQQANIDTLQSCVTPCVTLRMTIIIIIVIVLINIIAA